MLWLNISQEACTSISMQFMNSMTMQVYMYIYCRTRFILSSLHDNKSFVFILPRLNRRDEQLHHLGNDYKKLNEEVMNLRMELGREKEKCKKLEDSNKHLAEDRDQFKDR